MDVEKTLKERIAGPAVKTKKVLPKNLLKRNIDQLRKHAILHWTDDILKKDLLDKYVDIIDVFLVVDDRNKVVDMWRSLGLTVFLVADGNF